MKQPLQRLRNILNFLTFPIQFRPIDHDDWKSKVAGGINFTARSSSSRIFGHKQFYFMALQKGDVILYGKRPTRNNAFKIGQRNVRRGGVNQTQEVAMLRLQRKFINMHAPNGEHDATRRNLKPVNSGRNTVHTDPGIAPLYGPRRPAQSQQGHFQMRAGINGIAAHLNSKRMRSIDHMRNHRAFYIVTKPSYPAKSADAFWQGLGFDSLNAPRIRQNSVYTRITDFFGEARSLYRASQYKKINCHV